MIYAMHDVYIHTCDTCMIRLLDVGWLVDWLIDCLIDCLVPLIVCFFVCLLALLIDYEFTVLHVWNLLLVCLVLFLILSDWLSRPAFVSSALLYFGSSILFGISCYLALPVNVPSCNDFVGLAYHTKLKTSITGSYVLFVPACHACICSCMPAFVLRYT